MNILQIAMYQTQYHVSGPFESSSIKVLLIIAQAKPNKARRSDL